MYFLKIYLRIIFSPLKKSHPLKIMPLDFLKNYLGLVCLDLPWLLWMRPSLPLLGGSEAGGLHRALLAGPLLKRVKSAPHRWGCARGQQADVDGPEAGANGDVGLGGALGGAPLAPAKKGGGRGWGRGRPHLGSFRPLAPSGSSASAGGSFTSAGTASVAGVAKEEDCRRASSRGLIPRAKVKTVKMTLVIVFGESVGVIPDKLLIFIDTKFEWSRCAQCSCSAGAPTSSSTSCKCTTSSR